MSFSHRNHFVHYHFFPPAMKPLFFTTFLRSLADEVVGVFVPIFLFSLGRSMVYFPFLAHVSGFVRGMLLVSFYYAFQRLSQLTLAIPVTKIMQKVGYVTSMIIGNIALCVTFTSFHFAQHDIRFLILSFIGGSIDMLMYGVSHDSLFVHIMGKQPLGKEVGLLAFFTKLAQIIAPAFSGFLIGVFGFSVTFGLGIALLMSSCLPLLLLPHIAIIARPSFKELKRWMHEKWFRTFGTAIVGKYMDTMALTLWPVYVLIIVGGIARVGYLFSLALFASLLISYVAGWYVDHTKKGKFFVYSGVILSVAWIIRLFVRGIADIVCIELMDKLALSFYSPCFDAYMFEQSRERKVFSFLLYKEVMYAAFAVFLWVGVALLFLLPIPWTIIFAIGALGILLSLSIKNGKIAMGGC